MRIKVFLEIKFDVLSWLSAIAIVFGSLLSETCWQNAITAAMVMQFPDMQG